MPEIEIVKESIRRCAKVSSKDDCNGCHYQNDYAGFARRDCGETSCVSRLMEDALALLNDQEPMTPGLKQDAVGIWNTCPRCGHILKSALYDPLSENSMFFHYPNYCEACGQAVKWE